MKIKVLEIRDKGTFIPALCVDMNPAPPYPANGSMTEDEFRDGVQASGAQHYLLRRCGYPCDHHPNILLTHLRAGGDPAWNDPYGWGGRTYPVAHNWIIENWESLKDGDVVDVQFILGETEKPKISEREETY